MDEIEISVTNWEDYSLKVYATLAQSSLSPTEKAGRYLGEADIEKLVFQDVILKAEIKEFETILDIGCGCGPFVTYLTEFARANGSILSLIDQHEVLEVLKSQLDTSDINLKEGIFPYDFQEINQKFDIIIVYGVLQYVSNQFAFLEKASSLLEHGGRLLIGDIPNVDAKNRFLGTETGKLIHEDYLTKQKSEPSKLPPGQPTIDDKAILDFTLKLRNRGFETYILPQPSSLPFSNSREDLLVVKREK